MTVRLPAQHEATCQFQKLERCGRQGLMILPPGISRPRDQSFREMKAGIIGKALARSVNQAVLAGPTRADHQKKKASSIVHNLPVPDVMRLWPD